MILSDTCIKSLDLAIKALLYARFGDLMDIDIESDETENIKNNIVRFPKSVALRTISEKRGRDFLDFISYWKTNAELDWSRQTSFFSRNGMTMTNANNQTYTVKGVPVKMDYDIWFWSKDKEKLNTVMEKYFLWLHDFPRIIMDFNGFTYEPYLKLNGVSDESEVEDIYNKGMYFVYRMSISIDSWVFSIPDTQENIIDTIILTVYDKDSLLSSDVDVIIVEDLEYPSELSLTLRYYRQTTTGYLDSNDDIIYNDTFD